MKRYIFTFLAAASCALQALAYSTAFKVYDVDVNVDEAAKTLSVAIQLNMADYKLGGDRELILTPVIISEAGTDSLELEPVTVCGRNRYFYYMRKGQLDAGDERIYRAGSKQRPTVTETVPFEDWMGRSSVEMREEAANCCSRPENVPGPSRHGLNELALIDTRRPPLPVEFVFAPPVDDKPVEKNIEGKAFVSFVVNRTELKPDYMVNKREIAKILNSIDYVRQDTDAVITNVHIKGFASPEGSYSNNVRLAQGRTVTLSNYVRDLYHFDRGIMSTSFEPEDWEGLRRYLTDSLDYDIPHRAEILGIVDSPMEPDAKDHYIRDTYPADYKVILKEIYPWLRHSDYTVKYRIKVYTDIEELKRVFASDPTRLRPVDFYTLAQLHPEGSPEYLKVMETAVGVYPDDPMLNLNAANIELMRGDLERAQSHLLRAGSSPEADFARGVLAARRGDYSEATLRFEAARKAGIAKADTYLGTIDQIKAYHPVTITAQTTKPAESSK